MISCDPSKKAGSTARDKSEGDEELEEITGKRKYNPETGKYEVVNVTEEPMDTIRWTKVQTMPPITDFPAPFVPGETLPESEIKDSYTISLLVPFMTDRIDLAEDEIRDSYAPPLHFYAGMKLALQEYQQNASLEINVLDTRFSPGEVSELIDKQSLLSSDLVIGPWRSDNIRLVGKACLENKIPFVSPFYPSNNIIQENPYHIQVNPSLENHAKAIIAFAEEQYPVNNIILVERSKAGFGMFQDAHFALNQAEDIDSLAEYVLPQDPDEWKEINFVDQIQPGETTVFIIPAASRSDETFVHNILRLIDLARKEEDVVVIGMPNWKTFEKISYDYFEKLNVHISSAFYINKESPRVKNFRRAFYEAYGTLPMEEAYRGYDIMDYFSLMISRHGTAFQHRLDQEQMDVLHTRLEFQKVVPQDAIREEDYTRVARFENGFVNILEFENYDFHPIK